MKALSIRQPWAWAVLYAGKDVENRDWRINGPHMAQACTLQNSDILLHAAKGMTQREYMYFIEAAHAISEEHPFPSGLTVPESKDLLRGGIVGRARFVGIVSQQMLPEQYETRPELRVARTSPWFFGPYGLVLANVKPTRFISFPGSLGFFSVPAPIVREALAA